MHKVKYHILKKLTTEHRATYSELKPPLLASNAFNYHLKGLIQEKLVYKRSTNSKHGEKNIYQLSASGKLLADKISFTLSSERIQPKIVNLLIIERKSREYLFYKRTRLPFINHIGFPYGKIHLEERISEAARRELMEKTKLSIPLKHIGDVYLAVHNETELVSHMLCHIFYGKVSKNNQSIDPGCFWSTINNIPKHKAIPGMFQIEKLAHTHKPKSSNRFFKEFFLNTSEE